MTRSPDEVALNNPPGLEHDKRYEDIATALAAGIDVYSTVNVQHLESLNEQVAELTGVLVRETVPDGVLAHILLPFTGTEMSRRAVDTALGLSRPRARP